MILASVSEIFLYCCMTPHYNMHLCDFSLFLSLTEWSPADPQKKKGKKKQPTTYNSKIQSSKISYLLAVLYQVKGKNVKK